MEANKFKGGEIINKKLFVSLIIICFILVSLNMVFASNETNGNVISLKESNNELNIEISKQNSAIDLRTSSKTIEITQDNYGNYFDVRTGKIIDASGISNGDTLKIGNISNRAFVIDRQLTLMPISSNDKISNGFIHLINGSDGSIVTNLTIHNTKGTLKVLGSNVGQLHGIWLSHSNNNLISYNTIRIAKC